MRSIWSSSRNRCITRCIPEHAIAEAARILRPGGRIAILDLAKHRFEEAREIYADEWRGFSEAELESMLQRPASRRCRPLWCKKTEPPHFQTLLAVAHKPAR